MGESGVAAASDGGDQSESNNAEPPARRPSAVTADSHNHGPSASTVAHGDALTPPTSDVNPAVCVVVAKSGNVILDLTFRTSNETLRRAKKAELAANIGKTRASASTTASAASSTLPRTSTVGSGTAATATPTAAASPPIQHLVSLSLKTPHTKPTRPPGSLVNVAYRVSLDNLTKYSKYFAQLLTNSSFKEASLIAEGHALLRERGVNPSEASEDELPRIAITDDDDATKAAGREVVFEDMLRIIHQLPVQTSNLSMPYIATLAITADRFDCSAVVARHLNGNLRFKWPVTAGKPLFAQDVLPSSWEQLLRQKVLVSWLLGQPMRLHQSSREIIIRGSWLWSPFHEENTELSAAWWSLPDGLERELQYRRECILNTVASVQRHFLALYTSRDRQCKLGYDSSAACDSFQLGQMIRFLTSKNLLFLVDFGPSSIDSVPDTSQLDIEELLNSLKQCPNYQIDKYHTNCGLRIRIDPILDYLRAMLSANSLSISCSEWKDRKAEASWEFRKASDRLGVDAGTREDMQRHLLPTETTNDRRSSHFSFTRAMANDQRLKFEGAFYVDKIARTLFTSQTWDWTPEA